MRTHDFDCILRNACNHSGKTALVSGDLFLTFGDVPIHVNSLARGLLNSRQRWNKAFLESVSDYVGGQIAGFKKPRQVIFVDELPHENDEIDREAVKLIGENDEKVTPESHTPK